MAVSWHGAGDGAAEARGFARRAWAAYAAAGIAVTLAYLFLVEGPLRDALYSAFALTSVAAIVVGVRMHRPARPAPWWLFGLGTLLFVAGDVTLLAWDHVAGGDVPTPSLADAFFLTAYPTVGAGLLLLIRERRSGADRGSLIDATIMAIGVGVLSWIFLMTPSAHDATLPLASRLIAIGYPLGDLLLLGLVARLAVAPGPRPPTFHLLASSLVALMAADTVYGAAIVAGTYSAGSAVDALFLVFYTVWGAAALHPSLGAVGVRARESGTRLTARRLTLLAAASLIAPAVLFVEGMSGDTTDLPVVAAAAALLFLLVMGRMWGLVRSVEAALRDHRAAVRRERILRAAAAGLVAAPDRDAVRQAGLAASRALVSGVRGAHARLVVDRAEVRRLAELPEPGARALTRTAVVPLLVGDDLHGAIAVTSDCPLPDDVRNGLLTVAAQTALALEGAGLAESLVLRQSEARLSSLVQHSSDVITIVGAGRRIRYQSPSVERVLGHGAGDLLETDLLELVHPDDRDRLGRFLAAVAVEDRPGASVDVRMRHHDGGWRHTETTLSNLLDDPTVQGLVLNTRDVSERRSLEERLAHQAFHDSLTGLANRELLKSRLQHALARRGGEPGGVAVLFLDLDDFKTVNDSLGHAAGDRLLVEVARRLESCLRPHDTVARLGGDEFAVVVEPARSAIEANELAERILAALSVPLDLGGTETVIRASIGIAACRPGDDADAALRNADMAMYMAKGRSKGRFVAFEPAMHDAVSQRLELSGDLRRAVEGGGLELQFQPIVALESGEVVGAEALARWSHPRLGAVAPSEFIPLAEETGLIVPLGRWALSEACRQAAAWPRRRGAPAPSVSVNLSARQVQDAGIVADVAGALAESGLDPRRLVLEITESVLMQETAATVVRLQELKTLGLRIAIDDFGTGYSSLSYLERFPVDELKIDRAFVERLGRGDGATSLAGAIVQLGETLNLQTVAEGIEAPEQREALLALGCDLGQGFLFGRPVGGRQLARLLRARAGDDADLPCPGAQVPAAAVR